MVRWITDVEGVANFRDLSTACFPPKLVYRSADLSSLTTSSLPKLAQYVDTIIDVRSMPEIRRNGTCGPVDAPIDDETLSRHGMRRIHAPIFAETDYSPAAIARRHALYQSGHDGFIDAYRGILDHCGPTLARLFSIVAEKCSPRTACRGVLLHCSAGKDRTGILCAILLRVAGVSPSDCAAEYALTTEGLHGHQERILSGLGDVSREQRETYRLMMSSDAPVMQRTLAIVDQEYGGVEALCLRSVSREDYDIVKQFVSRGSDNKL